MSGFAGWLATPLSSAFRHGQIMSTMAIACHGDDDRVSCISATRSVCFSLGARTSCRCLGVPKREGRGDGFGASNYLQAH